MSIKQLFGFQSRKNNKLEAPESSSFGHTVGLIAEARPKVPSRRSYFYRADALPAIDLNSNRDSCAISECYKIKIS